MVELNATVLVQIVSFFILLFILKRILFEPLINVIEERRTYISDSEAKIKDKIAKLEESEKNYENQLIEAKKMAQEIINEHISIAEEEKLKILNEVLAETHKDFRRFELELEDYKIKLRNELKEDIEIIAQSVTDKVLTTNLSTKKLI